MKQSYVVLVLLLVCLSAFRGVAADNTPDLLALDSAFIAGEYERVELLGLRLLQSGESRSPVVTARISLTIGYALIMQSREREARSYFARALDADPTLVLDPVQVSPKFRMVFDEVKAERARAEATPPKQGTSAPDAQQAAFESFSIAPRSLAVNLLLPGTGQWREGHQGRGAVFLGLQAITVGMMMRALSDMRDSRAAYLSASEPREIAGRYDEYNRDYRAAWGWGIAASVIYLSAQLDLIRIGARAPTHSASRASLQFQINSAGAGVQANW